MAHTCPTNRCHKCPDLDGMIMPGCMGGAMWPEDFSRCTCERGSKDVRSDDDLKSIKRRLKSLEKAVDSLLGAAHAGGGTN